VRRAGPSLASVGVFGGWNSSGLWRVFLRTGAAISPALVDEGQGGELVRRGGPAPRWRGLLAGALVSAYGGFLWDSSQIGAASPGARRWRYTWQRMAWRFRKSLKLGPVRLNLSKSGVGYSIGGRGLRVGKDAKGRSYTAASIPGTGLYSRTYSGQGPAAGGNAAPESGGAAARQSSGAGLAVSMLALAFAAGILVTLILSAVLSTPPAPPPAPLPAVTAPFAPPAIPAKRRRAHRLPHRVSPPAPQQHADDSKPAIAPKVPHPST